MTPNALQPANPSFLTLPPEITIDIFTSLLNLHFGPSVRSIPNSGSPSNLEAFRLVEKCIIGLAGVCRLWRRIAQERPMLWADMYFDMFDSVPMEKQLEKIEAFLRLSRDALFSIEIRATGGGVLFYDQPSELIQLKNTLRPHMSRCRSFSCAEDENVMLHLSFP